MSSFSTKGLTYSGRPYFDSPSCTD